MIVVPSGSVDIGVVLVTHKGNVKVVFSGHRGSSPPPLLPFVPTTVVLTDPAVRREVLYTLLSERVHFYLKLLNGYNSSSAAITET